jgi:hypothetical protein
MLDVRAVTGAWTFGAEAGDVVGVPGVAPPAVEPPAVVGETAVAWATLPTEVPPETALFAPSAGVALLAIVARNVKLLHSVALRHRPRKTTSFVGLRG